MVPWIPIFTPKQQPLAIYHHKSHIFTKSPCKICRVSGIYICSEYIYMYVHIYIWKQGESKRIKEMKRNCGTHQEHMFLWLNFLILITDLRLKLFENWHSTKYWKAHCPISKEKQHLRILNHSALLLKKRCVIGKNFYLALSVLHFMESDKFISFRVW